MKKIINASLASLLFLFLLTPVNSLVANSSLEEVYENKLVEKISITMQNLPKGASFNKERVVSQLRTKKGDPFSQLTFDQDLKTLSEEYDKVEPNIVINVPKTNLVVGLIKGILVKSSFFFLPCMIPTIISDRPIKRISNPYSHDITTSIRRLFITKLL